MVNKKRMFGLSRDLEEGISETINTAKNNVGQLRYEIIPITRVHFDPENPRRLAITVENLKEKIIEGDPLYAQKKSEMEKLQSMANSIKKVGVRHAIEVYKDGFNYNLISGERRVLSSILAGKEDIPARILDNMPSSFDLKFLQWIENIEREDLTPWERANNVKQLIDAYETANKTKVTTAILGEILACSRQHASTLITVLEAPSLVQEALKTGKINNLEKAAVLARVKDNNLIPKLLEYCVQGITLENLKKLIERKPANKQKVVNKKGRPVSCINLGTTQNKTVVKNIIYAMLTNENYIIYKNQFENVNWDDYSAINEAFKKLLDIMEKINGV